MKLVRTNLWNEARARHIDQVCDRFERAWRQFGSTVPPRLEEFLEADGREPDATPDLFRELLHVEMECRGGLGYPVEVTEYRVRFSQFQEVLDEFFGTAAAAGQPLRPGQPAEQRDSAGSEPVPDTQSNYKSPSTCPSTSPRTKEREGSDLRAKGNDGTPAGLGQLGHYRLLEELGRGGMGVVYLAEDVHLQRRVAVKMMLPEVALSDMARERFLREARAAAAIQNDHVIPIFQVGEESGVPFLAMPFLEGESLESYLRRSCKIAGKPLPVAEVLRLGQEIASGLAAAHASSLVHRDIKPANIWLEGHRRRVRILDFGLARPTNPNVQLTAAGAIVGTPAYMAPEQATGDPVDARSDLFSLGCVLYRMTTGVAPFAGKDMMSILLAVCQQTPPAPRMLNPEVPQSLSDLILRLLAKKANHRPGSAGEVVALLEAVAEEQPPARQDQVKERIDRPAHLKPWCFTSRFRTIAVLLGFFMVAGCVLAAVMLYLDMGKGKGKMLITVDDPNLEVTVRGKTVHLENRKLGRSYVLALVPGKQEAGSYEIEVTEEPRGVKVVTRKLELPSVTVEVLPHDPHVVPTSPRPTVKRKPAYDPSHEDLKANRFRLVNKKTGKALQARLCEDPRRISEVSLVRKEAGTKWTLRLESDFNWLLSDIELVASNLSYVREGNPDAGRLKTWYGYDATCRWKRVEQDGTFALQTTAHGTPYTGQYLTADAKGDGVRLSKELTEGSKWTFEPVPRK